MDLLNILRVISRMNETQLHMMSLHFVSLYLLHSLKLYFSPLIHQQQAANSENISRLNVT